MSVSSTYTLAACPSPREFDAPRRLDLLVGYPARHFSSERLLTGFLTVTRVHAVTTVAGVLREAARLLRAACFRSRPDGQDTALTLTRYTALRYDAADGDPELRQPGRRAVLSGGAALQGCRLGERREDRRQETRHARLRCGAHGSGVAAGQSARGAQGEPERVPQHPHQRPMASRLPLDGFRPRRGRHPRLPLRSHDERLDSAQKTHHSG